MIAIGPGVVFSSAELWDHRHASPELATAFADAGIRATRQLGKRLHSLRGAGIERVGTDHDGALWMCAL